MVLQTINTSKEINKKSLAVLIDPDKINGSDYLSELMKICLSAKIDFFFVGGSLLMSDALEETIKKLKDNVDIPIVLFPGSNMQIDREADAILFLSLISGRNPEYLIGQHVTAAPRLYRSGLEVIPTGYILVGNDSNTTVAYISNTQPVPLNKTDVCVSTAIAGEMLGHRLIYLDAGSGAGTEVMPQMISSVKDVLDIPLIVGGGINTSDKVRNAYMAGADMVVLGTSIEKDMQFAVFAANIRDELNAVAIHS